MFRELARRIILIAVLTMAALAVAKPLERGEYAEIRRLAIAILMRYPPSEYVYVGVGRSPTPIVRFLSEAGAPAYNLPASGAGFPLQGLSGTHQDRLTKHLTRYLPSDEMLGGKKILLIDFAATGNSLVVVDALVEQALAARHSKTRVEALGILSPTTRQAMETRERFNKMGIPTLDAKEPVSGNMILGNYESWAEYDRTSLPDVARATSEPSVLTRRPEYEELGASLRAEMIKDDGLPFQLHALQVKMPCHLGDRLKSLLPRHR